jgi:S1-C subfamily serine protease
MLPFQAVGTLIHGPGDVIVVDQRVHQQENTNKPNSQPGTMRSSVVRLRCNSTNQIGTGFLHRSATIITTSHFVSACPKDSIVGVFSDGTKFSANKIITDISLDVAIVYPDISLDGRPVILLSQENSIELGAPVAVWGFPVGISGAEPIMIGAIVSGVDREPLYDNNGRLSYRPTGLWVINGSINPGHSGSPVIRVSDGMIIGMVISKSRRSEGIGYALPSERVNDFLRRNNVMQ